MLLIRLALLALFAAAATTAMAQTPDTPPAPSVSEAPAPPAAATPPAPPPPPTGDAAQVIAVLDRFCAPAIRGEKPEGLATGLGLRKNRDGDFVLSLGGAKRITVSPPNPSNPTVCSLNVLYDVGGAEPIETALNNWALAHANPYVRARNHETSQVGDETHVTSTWSAVEADGDEGLVFIQARTADNKPLNGRADQATILFSVRPSA
jgi:hypothetical protein